MKKYILLLGLSINIMVPIVGMQQKISCNEEEVAFSDTIFSFFSDEKESRDIYFTESYLLHYEKEIIGGFAFSVYKVKRGHNAIQEFIQNKMQQAYSYNQAKSFGRLIAGHDYIVEFENISLKPEYQNRKWGKNLMTKFLDRVSERYSNSIIFLDQVPSFNCKSKTPSLLSSDYEKLERFYASFGAKKIPHVEKWLVIDMCYSKQGTGSSKEQI